MSLLILATKRYGFARSYFRAGMFRAHLPNFTIHLHAAAFTGWIFLLVTQTSLVAAGQVKWHRRLGIAGFCLACLMMLAASSPAKGNCMNTENQIREYIATQAEPKRGEMQQVHDMILALMPTLKLWFLDGKDDKGKIVSNPNIGYGSRTIKYTDGRIKEFYQIGISGNSTGISVYIMGINDKTTLARMFGPKLGKASVTGYCIKFKSLADIRLDVLKAAIQFGIDGRSSV